MLKFWLIKETMPLLVALAIVAALFVGCVVWGFIESLRNKFREKPHTQVTP
jgi:peptidoglycan/LPS O-acetylase OafA/YrhL